MSILSVAAVFGCCACQRRIDNSRTRQQAASNNIERRKRNATSNSQEVRITNVDQENQTVTLVSSQGQVVTVPISAVLRN